MTDPRRILDDGSAPEALRTLLSHAVDDGLEAERVARVREGLQGSLATGGAVTSSTIGAKLVAVMGLGVVAIGAAVLLGRGPEPTPETTTPRPAIESTPSRPSPEKTSRPTPAILPPEVAAPSPEEATPVRSNKPVAAPVTPKEELELLLRARRSLDDAPLDSLRAAERHAKSFPKSALAEEREVITILALFALHRDAEALRRGKKFLEQHPASSHRPAVEAAMAEVSAP